MERRRNEVNETRLCASVEGGPYTDILNNGMTTAFMIVNVRYKKKEEYSLINIDLLTYYETLSE